MTQAGLYYEAPNWQETELVVVILKRMYLGGSGRLNLSLGRASDPEN